MSGCRIILTKMKTASNSTIEVMCDYSRSLAADFLSLLTERQSGCQTIPTENTIMYPVDKDGDDM